MGVRMHRLTSQIAGLAAAAALPATVTLIMLVTERLVWPVLAMVLILSLPLYVVGRDGARTPSHGD